LNDLGDSSTEIAKQFSLDAVMSEMLARKAKYGRAAHADFCKIEGRTVNDWLSLPEGIPALLGALEDSLWVQRHRDPEGSRFWSLLQGTGASMFGVFNSLEMQLIYDWIAGDCPDYLAGPKIASEPARTAVNGRHVPHRVEKKLTRSQKHTRQAAFGVVQPSDHGYLEGLTPEQLVLLLCPANHHSNLGLAATTRFARWTKTAFA
jgi:hypothetical protein